MPDVVESKRGDRRFAAFGRLGRFLRPAGTANAFLHAIFPARCVRCREFYSDLPDLRKADCGGSGPLPESDGIRRQFADLTASFLCPECRTALDPVASPYCSKCGDVFSGSGGPNHVCSDCMHEPRQYGIARAAGLYSGALRDVIQEMKYGGRVHLAGPLGRWMAEQARRYWQPEDIDLVLPVPLHPKKFRRRGFNQAYLLLPPLLSWAVSGRQQTRTTRGALVRIRATRPQTGMKKMERRNNVSGAFAVRDPEMIRKKNILLVDDVLTTGATVNACARALRDAGALRVDVMTLSRASHQPSSCRM